MDRRLAALCLLALACTGEPEPLPACTLADDAQTRPECDDGPWSCTFDTVTVDVTSSCGDCQARAALYTELCAQGETASADDIEAATVCDAQL
ncbi:MAG: hypothetical protein R3F59_33320 [Myxococcota bacterium]